MSIILCIRLVYVFWKVNDDDDDDDDNDDNAFNDVNDVNDDDGIDWWL